ncbi:MAG: hypothetical protein GY941_21800 [Planctomycetes bacterium]|nr:hypothetical protein [Planctomycetota bacterium]
MNDRKDQHVMNISKIHLNQINGNMKDMVTAIDEYGLYDFWEAYRTYLLDTYVELVHAWRYYTDATIAYHRIKNR